MPKAPKISKETLALVNKVREVNNTLSDGGVTCLRFSEVEEMMDALTDVVKFFDLKHKGGISKGKYVEYYYSDYVAPTDPEAYDPKKDEENDDE